MVDMSQRIEPERFWGADNPDIIDVDFGDDIAVEDHPPARRWPWAIVLVVLAVLAAGIAYDSARRTTESNELLASTREAIGVIAAGDAKVSSTIEYVGPNVQDRPDLSQLVQEDAQNVLAQSQTASYAVAGSVVWPWHESQQRLRMELSAYLSSLRSRQVAWTAWPTVEIPNDGELQRALDRLETALKSAGFTLRDLAPTV